LGWCCRGLGRSRSDVEEMDWKRCMDLKCTTFYRVMGREAAHRGAEGQLIWPPRVSSTFMV
jgi:hypothetical protein